MDVFRADIDGRKIYLLDTPGFDDTNMSDITVLRMLAAWLTEADHKRLHLAGIVYLHRICDHRMSGTAMKNLRMFRKLCGEEALSHVVLATTMWDMVPQRLGNRRLRELKTNPNYWANMIKEDSTVFRQDKGADSARDIIRHICARSSATRLRIHIQKEMADGIKLDGTAAGREAEAEMKGM